jgi:hypothetical protein
MIWISTNDNYYSPGYENLPGREKSLPDRFSVIYKSNRSMDHLVLSVPYERKDLLLMV